MWLRNNAADPLGRGEFQVATEVDGAKRYSEPVDHCRRVSIGKGPVDTIMVL